MPLTSHPADAVLDAFVKGRTDESMTEQVARHLEVCDDCQLRVSARRADAHVPAANPSGEPPPTLRPEFGSPTAAAVSDWPDLGDNYRIEKVLGRGGMGTVYLTRNTLMDRLEVIKVMNAEVAIKPGATGRFLKEIQAAARLSHPNVVTAYTALRPNGRLALSMAFVNGLDLDRQVKTAGPLPVPRACDYVAQAARGLQHALDQGLVHRDIKPANLMTESVTGKTVVKVLDFGLAKFKRVGEDGRLTASGQMMGTPAYIAPEQAANAAGADTRADIYSLGCTLYFLLTGRAPFTGGVMEVLTAHALTAPTPPPDVPADVWLVVAKMLAKNPADRYQTPGEVEQVLLAFAEPKVVPTTAPPSPDMDASAAGDPNPLSCLTLAPVHQALLSTANDLPSPAAPVPTPQMPFRRRVAVGVTALYLAVIAVCLFRPSHRSDSGGANPGDTNGLTSPNEDVNQPTTDAQIARDQTARAAAALADLSVARTALNAVSDDLAQTKTRLTADIEELKARFVATTTEKETAEKQLAVARTDIASLETKLTKSATDFQAVVDELRKKQRNADELEKKLAEATIAANEQAKKLAGAVKVATDLGELARKKDEDLKKADAKFAGIVTTGKRVVLVVDTSGSMREVESGKPDPTKWAGVVETVGKVLRSIPDLEKVQVVTFDAQARYLFDADRWIDYAGEPTLSKITAGLLAVKLLGDTNLHDGLDLAFRKKADGLDAVYLFSDGLPTSGPGLTDAQRRLTESEQAELLSRQLRQKLAREWNPAGPRRVRINAVGFYHESPAVGAFLWSLARENDGSFVGMSRP